MLVVSPQAPVMSGTSQTRNAGQQTSLGSVHSSSVVQANVAAVDTGMRRGRGKDGRKGGRFSGRVAAFLKATSALAPMMFGVRHFGVV